MRSERICVVLNAGWCFVSTTALFTMRGFASENLLFMYRYCFCLISSLLSILALTCLGRRRWIGRSSFVVFGTVIVLEIMESYARRTCGPTRESVLGVSCSFFAQSIPPSAYSAEYALNETTTLLAMVFTMVIMWYTHVSTSLKSVTFPQSHQHLLSYTSSDFISVEEGSIGHDHSPKMVYKTSCFPS
jgi:hypothetical protein